MRGKSLGQDHCRHGLVANFSWARYGLLPFVSMAMILRQPSIKRGGSSHPGLTFGAVPYAPPWPLEEAVPFTSRGVQWPLCYTKPGFGWVVEVYCKVIVHTTLCDFYWPSSFNTVSSCDHCICNHWLSDRRIECTPGDCPVLSKTCQSSSVVEVDMAEEHAIVSFPAARDFLEITFFSSKERK